MKDGAKMEVVATIVQSDGAPQAALPGAAPAAGGEAAERTQSQELQVFEDVE
jgi:hypothetical protein